MKPCVFWCILLFGVIFLNSKGLCRPSEEDPPEYAGDEEEEDYDQDEDEKAISGPPPVILSKSGTITAKAGDTVKLPCKIENGDTFVILWVNTTNPDKPSAIWVGKNRQIDNDRINKTEDNSIEIKNVNVYDSGSYQCKVIAGSSELVVTHTLIVQAPIAPGTKPTITVFKPNKEYSVKKGQELTLMCEATGNPQPSITWSKNDNKNSDVGIQNKGSIFTVESVTRKNSGIYTCNAENNLGKDTKSVTVHVHYIPEIEMEEDYITSVDDISVNLICTVHATPRPKVSWLKDGKPLPQSLNMVNEKNKYTLHLQNIKPADFGEYTCEATNKEGHSQKSRILSGKPKKPVLENTKDDSDGKKPQMVWKIESYSPITDYELMFKTRQEEDWKTIRNSLNNEDKNSFVYFIKHGFEKSLSPAEYETKLRVKNKYGWSEVSDIHFFTKDEEGDLSETGPLEAADRSEETSSASELRISAVLVFSLLAARFYC